jgi:LPS export ABC transporter protein LptC
MSNFKPRNLLLVSAFVLAASLLAFILVNRRPEVQVQQAIKALPKGIDIALSDIDYTHIEDGQARWRMVAKEVKRQADSGVLSISNPRLSFFDADGDVVGRIQAEKGTVTEDYQMVRMLDNVVLENDPGYAVFTDSLNYDHNQQLAISESNVRLETDGMKLQGTGMRFHVPEKKLQFLSNVKGHFLP